MTHGIDAHFDLLLDVAIQREHGRRKVIETDYLPDFVAGGVDTVVAAIFIDNKFLPEMGLRKALQQISALHAEADESPDKIMVCKSVSDIETAKRQGKIGFVLSLEGAEPLYNDLSMLRVFYELGVRLMGLVWSRRNFVGDGSHFSPVREGRKGGLTEFGIRVVEEAEAMGIIIDVSHLNDEGFWDLIEVARKPIIASHSNCRTLASSMRNLTDEQIRAIAFTNGVIGINGVNLFVGDTDDQADIEHMINHVDHIVKLVGDKHVGLGLDIIEPFMKYDSPGVFIQAGRKDFDVVKGHTKVPELVHALAKRGYKDEAIERILGKNFIRVFKDVWKS
ncbi:dipeptidase [Brevibacillus brevis]|uniref:dipeptidase n=1 Tax=Brevibacillus brevis TaxID=1393 RepID=UPI001C8DDCB7|nr:dipeptidase [Brevibacillus brevis]MBY0087049.1 membrane dipeptidase [Brevibacillus brevis]